MTVMNDYDGIRRLKTRLMVTANMTVMTVERIFGCSCIYRQL